MDTLCPARIVTQLKIKYLTKPTFCIGLRCITFNGTFMSKIVGTFMKDLRDCYLGRFFLRKESSYRFYFILPSFVFILSILTMVSITPQKKRFYTSILVFRDVLTCR